MRAGLTGVGLRLWETPSCTYADMRAGLTGVGSRLREAPACTMRAGLTGVGLRLASSVVWLLPFRESYKAQHANGWGHNTLTDNYDGLQQLC